MRIDVLVFGGGAAGLWCLDRLRRAGYHALLLESQALGCGQTIQSQGIIHGGGKYALRGVRDFAAVRATSMMPERWRRCIKGEGELDLSATRILSESCYLWLPKGSALARVQSRGVMSVIAKAGLLATPPRHVPNHAWPQALSGSALAVYSLAEPVIATATLLQCLADRHRERIFFYTGPAARLNQGAVQLGEISLRPRAVLLTAGTGNEDLLANFGLNGAVMQRRPLGMVLLRGELPPLFGHCIAGGKTALTVTTPVPGIWQIGGELAERLAEERDSEKARVSAVSELRRQLPALSFAGAEIAIYRAVRAEARTAALRRPSGVHASEIAPGFVVAWPTKLSMTPVLAEEVFDIIHGKLQGPAGYSDIPPWPAPPVARYPWEEAEWFAVP